MSGSGLDRLLDDLAADPRVEDRVDRPGAVGLEGRRQRVGTAHVEDVGEWQEAVVADPAGRIGGQHPGEVAALVEQLGRIGQLGRDEAGDGVGRQVRPLRLVPEVRPRDVAGQHPGVVARAMDRARVGRHAVLLEALRRPGRWCPRSRSRARSRSPTTASGRAARSRRTSSRRGPAGPSAGTTKPVAEMASSTSTVEVGAAVGPAQVGRQPAVAPSARCGRSRHPGR